MSKKKTNANPPENIKRVYKGKEYVIQEQDGIYYHAEQTFKSLTAIAQFITGYKNISGPAFFKTAKKTVAV